MMSMSLRNELRSADSNTILNETSYGWSDWYKNVIPAATTIFDANPFPLIFFSGLAFDTDSKFGREIANPLFELTGSIVFHKDNTSSFL